MSATEIAVVISSTLFASITAPIIISRRGDAKRHEEAVQEAETRKREKEEDWARQDEVALRAQQAAETLAESQDKIAEQAREAATLLLAEQKQTNEKTDEVARIAAQTAAEIALKLQGIDSQTRDIHTLVNSDMTAARQLALDQMRATRHALIRAAGSDPSQWTDDDKETIQTLETRIAEQERILADRLSAFKKVEADEAAEPESGITKAGE